MNGSAVQTRRLRVSGKVQGVFFRTSTRQQALQLGLTGYACNQTDGSVEVLVCGSVAALDQLSTWLWQGPPLAQVTNVEVLEQVDEATAMDGFATR
jgi:acylphosphatase